MLESFLVYVSEEDHIQMKECREVISFYLRNYAISNWDKFLYGICKHGDYVSLQLLLSNCVVRINPGGFRQGFCIAAERGHCLIVYIMMNDYRMDLDWNDEYLLRRSFLNGHLDVAHLLLQDPRTVPTKYHAGIALQLGLTDLVYKILFDERLVDTSNAVQYLLQVALGYNKDVFHQLLSNQSLMNRISIDKVLKKCLHLGQEELFQSIWNSRLIPRVNIHPLFVLACKNGMESIYNTLKFEKELCLYGNRNEALKAAFKSCHFWIVRLLILDGFDPSFPEYEPFIHACKFSDVKIVEYIIRCKNLDPSCYDNLPIRAAAKSGNSNVVAHLLSYDK